MPRGLANISVADLHAELRRRQRSVGRLVRRRASLLTRLTRLDDLIEMLGGSANGRTARRARPARTARGGRGRGPGRRPGRRGRGGRAGRRRPRNEMTLSAALAKALSGKTMSVTEAAGAVRRAGYRTNSSNFRTQVNIALIKGPFKRVGRGQYTAN